MNDSQHASSKSTTHGLADVDNATNATRCAQTARCFALLLAGAGLILVSGCLCGAHPPIGYNLFATIQDENGQPLSGITIEARMVDQDRVTILWPGYPFPDTSDAGEFEGKIEKSDQRCPTPLDVLLSRPLVLLDAPLPNPAFIILLFPGTGEEISIEVAEAMITRNPEGRFDDLDLGVVTVPAQ